MRQLNGPDSMEATLWADFMGQLHGKPNEGDSMEAT